MDSEKTTYTVWGIGEGVHETDAVKPITTPAEQIELLKAKGVTFERCDEERALEILSGHETYLHLTAYRVLFQRHADGTDEGKFVSLDFGDLLDVCALDDTLREAFRLMAKDIERVVKTWLVTKASLRGEDGYGIVADFVESLPPSLKGSLRRELDGRAKGDVYAGSLIDHYRDAMPAWVLLEVVPFGTLLAFYLFCVDRWGEACRREFHYALKDVKAVRNCASHGGCLLNGLVPGNETSHVTSSVAINWLNSHDIGNTKGRRAKLRNRRIQQMVTTIALYDTIVEEKEGSTVGTIRALQVSLAETVERYGSQNPFVSYLVFLMRVLDAAAA